MEHLGDQQAELQAALLKYLALVEANDENLAKSTY
jgi:hypothetical protein